MTALRYCILDEAGLVINVVIVDDPYPEGYWSGYGRYITCAFGEPNPTPPANLDIRTGDNPFTYLTVRPTAHCWTGDTMNPVTGEVTPAPIPEPAPEEPVQ